MEQHIKVALIALGLLACNSDRPDTIGERYMPPEAAGVAIGMTFPQLKRARPAVLHDTYSVFERLDAGSVTYWFSPRSRPSQPRRLPHNGGDYVSAVQVDRPEKDTANAHRALIETVRRWNLGAASPTLDSAYTIPGRHTMVRIKTFTAGTVKLAVMSIEGDTSSVSNLIRLLVVDGRVPIHTILLH